MYDKKKWIMVKLKAGTLASIYLKNKDQSALTPTELANEFIKVEEEIGKALVSHYAVKEWEGKECHGKEWQGKEWEGKGWHGRGGWGGKECPSKESESKE